jgi:hypothetical protein
VSAAHEVIAGYTVIHGTAATSIGNDDAAMLLHALAAAGFVVINPADPEVIERVANVLKHRWGYDDPGRSSYDATARRALAALGGDQPAPSAVANPDAIPRCPVRGYNDERCVRPALHDGHHEWWEGDQ